MQQVKEWILAVLLIALLLAALMFGGVLITVFTIVVTGVFVCAVAADLVRCFFSLFRRGAKRLDGKRREE